MIILFIMLRIFFSYSGKGICFLLFISFVPAIRMVRSGLCFRQLFSILAKISNVVLPPIPAFMTINSLLTICDRTFSDDIIIGVAIDTFKKCPDLSP